MRKDKRINRLKHQLSCTNTGDALARLNGIGTPPVLGWYKRQRGLIKRYLTKIKSNTEEVAVQWGRKKARVLQCSGTQR